MSGQADPAPSRVRAASSVALAALALVGASGCTREVRVPLPDDEPRVLGHRSARDHVEVGVWAWTYPNGVPRERGAYVDGLRVGTWNQWWSNGERRSEGERRPDPATKTSPRHGPWTFWHANGVTAARGVYENGRRTGMWEFSIDDGRLDGDRSGLYHDDARIADG